jgi:hypothetical protein
MIEVDGPGFDGPGFGGLGVDGLGVDGLGVDGLGVDGLGVDGLGVESFGLEDQPDYLRGHGQDQRHDQRRDQRQVHGRGRRPGQRPGQGRRSPWPFVGTAAAVGVVAFLVVTSSPQPDEATTPTSTPDTSSPTSSPTSSSRPTGSTTSDPPIDPVIELLAPTYQFSQLQPVRTDYLAPEEEPGWPGGASVWVQADSDGQPIEGGAWIMAQAWLGSFATGVVNGQRQDASWLVGAASDQPREQPADQAADQPADQPASQPNEPDEDAETQPASYPLATEVVVDRRDPTRLYARRSVAVTDPDDWAEWTVETWSKGVSAEVLLRVVNSLDATLDAPSLPEQSKRGASPDRTVSLTSDALPDGWVSVLSSAAVYGAVLGDVTGLADYVSYDGQRVRLLVGVGNPDERRRLLDLVVPDLVVKDGYSFGTLDGQRFAMWTINDTFFTLLGSMPARQLFSFAVTADQVAPIEFARTMVQPSALDDIGNLLVTVARVDPQPTDNYEESVATDPTQPYEIWFQERSQRWVLSYNFDYEGAAVPQLGEAFPYATTVVVGEWTFYLVIIDESVALDGILPIVDVQLVPLPSALTEADVTGGTGPGETDAAPGIVTVPLVTGQEQPWVYGGWATTDITAYEVQLVYPDGRVEVLLPVAQPVPG